MRELAPAGILRAAINLGNPVLAKKHANSGELTGVAVDLARELGSRLELEVALVTYAAASQVFEAATTGAWDVAFVAIDPARASELLFTAPYVIIEGSYIVRDDSPFRAIEDLDQRGVLIAVGKGAAYDLYLSRTLKHAELVRCATSANALDLFIETGLQAAAGVKQTLFERAAIQGGLRVITGRFTTIEQALATPRGRPRARAYLHSFIEVMKSNGFVAAALERSGQREAVVAPPQAHWPQP